MKLLNRFFRFFKPGCPECSGKLSGSFIDMQFDKVIYECECCKKQFI